MFELTMTDKPLDALETDAPLKSQPDELGWPASLQLALGRLDRLLESALQKASVAYGPLAGSDPFRGLHLEEESVARLLARSPGESLLYWSSLSESPLSSGEGRSPFDWLQQAYGLEPVDLDILLIGLAPEVDRRYEKIFAYLQDDISQRRPSVDLALNLLCPTFEARLAGQGRFQAGAPLLRGQLIRLLAPPNISAPALLAKQIRLDEQVTRLVLGLPGLDERLAAWTELSRPSFEPGRLPLDAPNRRLLETISIRIQAREHISMLYLYGPPGSGRRLYAEALAGSAGKGLLTADLGRLPADPVLARQALQLAWRESLMQNALLYLEHADEAHPSSLHQFLSDIRAWPWPVVLAGRRFLPPDPAHPLPLLPVAFKTPPLEERRQLWQAALAEFFPSASRENAPVNAGELEALAGRFRLTPGQIRSAAAMASAQWIDMAPGQADAADPRLAADLYAAARAQNGHALDELAQKLTPVSTWPDLILPLDSLLQLREISQRVRCRARVLEHWGFERKLSLGKGINALFAGPSGTGKTMAAEVLANDLELDLYRINLAGVVSKYIGETEKNLERIFSAAESANAILFFDEADALFGKRSEVRDSHDRYANIEISYLLQKMEQYDGIAILATNLRQNLDEAFVRRLAFSVHFPFPEAASRLAIWRGVWPPETPLENDLDFSFLAERYRLSGGNIKNVALAAAFEAAVEERPVAMRHLLHALRREYQKLGKPQAVEELEPALQAHPGGNGLRQGGRQP
jgi:AAA+ superfamily predicted ATPase